jgi:hypothetical protein
MDIAKGTLTNQNELISDINRNPANTRNLTGKLNIQLEALKSNNTNNNQMYQACLNALAQQK